MNSRNRINAKQEIHFTTIICKPRLDLLENKQTLLQFLIRCQAKIIKSTLWETSGLHGTIASSTVLNDLSIIFAYVCVLRTLVFRFYGKTLQPEAKTKL